MLFYSRQYNTEHILLIIVASKINRPEVFTELNYKKVNAPF